MNQSEKDTTGILLMAYGSPESVEDLEPYLLDIRNGRATPASLVEEIKDRYIQIGGRSPLLDLTRKQAICLENELNQRFKSQGIHYRTYVGMRHWQPRIKEAVSQMTADGINRLVALVMAPHSSRLSTGAYFKRLDEAINELGVEIGLIRIESWHNHPGLIEAIAEKAVKALEQFQGITPYVVFTAHSLPARILDQGDPYERQLQETANLLAQRLVLPDSRWQFSYQSAGRSSEAWLGPQIEEVVKRLAQSGEKNILIVPIGFVCDHVEVLYDIDIACRQLAAENGARLERSESLNDSPQFVQALADLVVEHLNKQPF